MLASECRGDPGLSSGYYRRQCYATLRQPANLPACVGSGPLAGVGKEEADRLRILYHRCQGTVLWSPKSFEVQKMGLDEVDGQERDKLGFWRLARTSKITESVGGQNLSSV